MAASVTVGAAGLFVLPLVVRVIQWRHRDAAAGADEYLKRLGPAPRQETIQRETRGDDRSNRSAVCGTARLPACPAHGRCWIVARCGSPAFP